MKALMYLGPEHVEVQEIQEPTIKEGQVKLKIICCGVCGSDMGIFLGSHPRAKAPLILGHEFLGTLVEDGNKFKKGDRVVAFPLISCGHCRACREGSSHVCNSLGLYGIDKDGGLAEYICIDEDLLFKVPEGVSDKAAVTTEPFAVIVRALHSSNFKALDTVAVSGAGPIGLLTGMFAKQMGAQEVFISDINEKRLETAKLFGLTPVNPLKQNFEKVVKAATDGEGCDVFFECSGSEAASMTMTDVTRVHGTICMVAVHKKAHLVNLQGLNFKEQTLVGTRVYTKQEFSQAVDYLPQIQNELEKIVTHIVSLKESPQVFDMIRDPQSATAKVVVTIGE